MKNTLFFFISAIFLSTAVEAQIKIGDNPQNINASSVLELESNSKVLVITRINTEKMNTITPHQGALVYNTDTQCIHFYNGTTWLNLCELNKVGNFTTNPIVNSIADESTIVITPTIDGSNFEVALNSIQTDQIQDGGIIGADIQDNSITANKLGDDSVGRNELATNAVGLDAIDFSELNLSSFANTPGFLTSANIVSTDFGNDIENRSDGVFFDQKPLLNEINSNTTAISNHITADTDTNIGNEIVNVTSGNASLLRSGTGSTLDPYTLAVNRNGITENEIADNSISSSKILDETINSDDILNGSITTIDIKEDAITAAKINEDIAGTGLIQNALGALEVDPNILMGDGDINSTDIEITSGINAVFNDVTLAIANNAITSAKILNENVTLAKIQPASIDPLSPVEKILATNLSGNVVWANNTSTNLANTNLTQTTGQDRNYDLNGHKLTFSGTTGSSVGIGNFGGSQPVQSSDKLDVNGQIRARSGFAASPGSAGEPSYGFYTDGDTDTGIYRAGPDQIGFSTNGIDAIRIDASQNVGIATVQPTSTLHTGGSFATAINRKTSAIVDLTTNNLQHTVILYSGVTNITLPAADSDTLGRIYILKNRSGVDVTTNINFIKTDGTSTNSILNATVVWLQSDGLGEWEQIN